ncbi:unnamed protein product [Nippostrongylus brasiliensis]|uniref:Membrane-associated protein n=1 Tax=Nippostrongylus brasiliensis TaxID=27835 RepID=A0A0N4YNU4_NIPBR|nr:unnamed protein product [Nippostrongylus brasiliensis]
MDHFMMFMLSNWLRSKRKIFQSRLAISVLITVNFGNSVILSLEAFGPDSLLSLSVFILNTVVVVLALYGIFAFKPIFLTPNVIAKVSLASAALFHGLQTTESNDSCSVFHFLWLLVTVCLFIWEIHAMFNTTFDVMREMKVRACSKPPPSYDQITIQVMENDAPPPTYAQAIERLHRPVVLDVAALEGGTYAAITIQVMENDAPPPTYAQAIERLHRPVVLDVAALEGGTYAAVHTPTSSSSDSTTSNSSASSPLEKAVDRLKATPV